MPERTTTDHDATQVVDELALCAREVETTIENGDFQEAAVLIEQDPAGVWFGLEPYRTIEILRQLLDNLAEVHQPILRSLHVLLESATQEHFDSPEFLSSVDFDNPREVYLLTLTRMGGYRMQGRATEELEQTRELHQQLGHMRPIVGSPDGLELHTTVQIAITAMLAGDFTEALTNFTRAQMHAPVPKFAFLTRDALTKAALIHACFGNSTTARYLLQRAETVPRTSSWAEDQIDAHRDFAKTLISTAGPEESLHKLRSISLHDIGEMWPFYIMATHRILETSGDHDELEHQMEMFDSMPFPRRDGDGFSGSVIPLKRALLAMKAGRGTEAQTFLDRADQNFSYTQLIQSAAHIYAGRPQQAIQDVTRLRPETRGFRLMEVRRLAILAAAQYQSNENADCIDTLARASELPRGLTPQEIQIFSPETRELAAKHVSGWPTDSHHASTFLTGLPKPGLALTDREVEILQYLAQELSRAEIAEATFISVNTLKTHLKAIYRKLGVSSAADAIIGAQRRGLL